MSNALGVDAAGTLQSMLDDHDEFLTDTHCALSSTCTMFVEISGRCRNVFMEGVKGRQLAL